MKIENALSQLRRIADRLWAAAPLAADGLCCVCGRRVRHFLPYRGAWSSMPSVLADADVVGSDVANFECPACGCHDRERHLYLYLQAKGLFKCMAGARILHLAPETHLQRVIAQAAPQDYVLGDLYPTRSDIRRIDLMDIDLPDSRLDFVIANHVLEHVRDDVQALREILRVLRPGGFAILQTPLPASTITSLKTRASLPTTDDSRHTVKKITVGSTVRTSRTLSPPTGSSTEPQRMQNYCLTSTRFAWA